MKALSRIPILLLCFLAQTAYSQIKFIENKGQLNYTNGKSANDVLFYGDAGNVCYLIRKTGVSYILSKPVTDTKGNLFTKPGEPVEGDDKTNDSLVHKGWRVDMNWIGSIETAQGQGENPLRHKQNYYTPRFPNGLLGVSSYEKVTVKNIYKNIDVVFYSRNNQLKYDYVVGKGGDYKQIKFAFAGATEVKLENSTLSVKIPGTSIDDFIPESYVVEKGKQKKIAMHFKQEQTNLFSIESKQVTGNFEKLVIDPAIWITYYGGSGFEYPYDIESDENGNVYMTGLTSSADLPLTPGAFQTVYPVAAGSSPYMSKFTAAGDLEWSTYYSGTFYEESGGCCVDTISHHVYMSGFTYSTDFPVTAGAWQTALDGTNADVFVVKFDENGVRVWATYLGGTVFDVGTKIDIDNNQNVWFTGCTSSPDWPTMSPYDGTFGGGGNDVFVAEFSPSCVLLYSTYLGGTKEEKGIDIDFTPGFIGICGNTKSTAYPLTADAYDATLSPATVVDGFYTKFNLTGGVVYSTLMGGNQLDLPQSINYDKLGFAVVAGRTASPDFPTTAGALQTVYGGGTWDVFMCKFKTDNSIDWSTYFGDSNSEAGAGVTIDGDNYIYLNTTKMDDTVAGMPVFTDCAFQKTIGGDKDLLIVKFSSACVPECQTYLGGILEDNTDIGSTNIEYYKRFLYISCYTADGFPVTPGAYQTTFGGYYDATLAKLCSIGCGDTLASFANFSLSEDSVCIGMPVQFDAAGISCDNYLVSYNWSFPGGTPSSSTIQNPVVIYNTAGSYTATLIVRSPCDTTVKTMSLVAGSYGALTASITPDVDSICAGQTVTITSVITGGTAPFVYQWSTSPADTLPTLVTSPSSSGYISLIADNPASCPGSDSVYITVLSITNLNAPGDTCICEGTSLVLTATGAPSYTWNTGATTASITVSPTTNFTYVVSYTNGVCSDVDSTVVCVSPLPFVAASADTSVEFPNTAVVYASGTGPFTWSPANSLNCNPCDTAIASPSETTTYIVTVTNPFGCSASDAVTVTITYALQIPNIITPNGDGLNDIFRIAGLPPDSEISIYNRWGNLMHQSAAYGNDWSSKSDGVYYYVLTISSGKTFKGFFHVNTGK